MYRFLLSRRWLGLFAFVLFMVVASWYLGNWQFDRWEARKTSNALAEAHMQEAPVPVADLIAADGTVVEDAEWTNVAITGQFRTHIDVVVRYIKYNDRPGVEVVTPFDIDGGDTVLVNRGWLKTANTGTRPDMIPPAPEGTVTIEGWWRPDNDAGKDPSTPVDGSVRAISSNYWTSILGEEALPGFVAQQEPVSDGLLPQKPPGLGEGPHLFYAIQWFFFGALAVFGGFWFIRDEVKERRADQAKLTRSA